ncbi:MAG: hypothetical protein OEY14_13550, partial [Myxococcales bacterium]|nr:hypothetical protein [Myxococcales bacterium]
GTSSSRWWTPAFPDGYSCGSGIPAPPGESFDGFEPMDCAGLEVTMNAPDEANWTWPNWT